MGNTAIEELQFSNANSLYNFGSDFKEAVKECNNTHYGLQSGIFTKDLNKAFYAFEHMEVSPSLTCIVRSSRYEYVHVYLQLKRTKEEER